MGHARVADVRQGKYFEVQVDAESSDEATSLVREIADTLLANPVIESYRLEA
jgi:phosphoribosylformylglycinamidine synthase